MSNFGSIERAVARVLGRAPRLKQLAKRLYQIANFLLFGTKGFECVSAAGVTVEEARDDGGRGSSASEAQRFFGYFDKSPWSRDMQGLLLHQVNSDGSLSLFHRESGRETELGRTRAWSWQQGAMLQWIPGAESRGVVYNTLHDGALSSIWLQSLGEAATVIPWPVQAIAPGADHFVSLNYLRLTQLRPDYGYVVDSDNFRANMPDDQDGIWVVDRASERADLVLSLAHLRAYEPTKDMDEAQHKVNHVLYNPSGERFVFLYRWFGSAGKRSRLFVYDLKGEALRLLMDDGMVSHYCWRDEDTLIVYGRTKHHGDAYYEVDVVNGEVKPLGLGVLDKFGDGHPSVSPDGRWLLTDTYPDRKRQQRLLLYNLSSGELREVARFLSPLRFDGVQRVDLHPRWSPDGTQVAVDAAHQGRRGLYLVDVSALVRSS